MGDTCMFVELSNDTSFPLFINNVFQSYKIILEHLFARVCRCTDTSLNKT
jgi:hypothetical protein